MKILFSWLKEFVEVRSSAEEIGKSLTFGGLEVEGIEEARGDKVFEVNVTANRGDCLSIQGIAREVAALTGGRLKKTTRRPVTFPRGGTRSVEVAVQDASRCPRYGLAVVKGVRVGPSPAWMTERLEACGIRPVNNVVDATNYVLMETGHPLHAFDLSKIEGGEIVVRKARPGEKITTLDSDEHELMTDDLVIADRERPIALAGIMGGKESEISEETAEIALECAFFDPAAVRKTARRLGIQTESSYRFERRVNPEGIPAALERVVGLILETAGGRVVEPMIDHRKRPFRAAKIMLAPGAVERLLGGSWSPGVVRDCLRRLGLVVREKGKDRWEVEVPPYRGDLIRDVDLVEEVARLSGLERIPTSFPSLSSAPTFSDADFERERRVKGLLGALGMRETIHFSFVSPDDLAVFGNSVVEEAVFLENPLGREDSVMRPTLVLSLLKTCAAHHRHKIDQLRLFEIGNCFRRKGKGLVEEKRLAGLLSGNRLQKDWSRPPEEIDFFEVKGVVERICAEAGTGEVAFLELRLPHLHPGKQAAVMRGKTVVGSLGEIHPDLQARLELKRRVYVFELEWDRLFDGRAGTACYREFSRHPVVLRDLALIVGEGTPAGGLAQAIRSTDSSIHEVELFDLYRGDPIPPGKKSLAFSVRLGRSGETLTEEEVNEVWNRVVEGVRKNFGAEVR